MAIKGGKLKKLMKKLSFGKTTQTNTSSSDSCSVDESGGLLAVYVGKSRRRYLVTSDVVDHPLFRQLDGKSTGAVEITVGCEVVLFDRLLWMLQNAEPESQYDELVGYYACC